MTDTRVKIIRLSAADNVVIAMDELDAGADISCEGVRTQATIPPGHKIATSAIAKGEAVRKYNQIIGFASVDIRPGDHVHVDNCGMADFERDYAYGEEARPTQFVPDDERATFQGIVRANGQVATRNYIGVITTVNCSATVAKMIAARIASSAMVLNKSAALNLPVLAH